MSSSAITERFPWLINAIHILLVAPFLLYLGVQKGRVPMWVYDLLVAAGILIAAYHIYLTYIKTGGFKQWKVGGAAEGYYYDDYGMEGMDDYM